MREILNINRLYTKTLARMTARFEELREQSRSKKGMELVQVGILIAIAVGIGIIFKDKITTFINTTFSSLLGTSFN